MVLFEITYELSLEGGYPPGDVRNYQVLPSIPLDGWKLRGGIYRRIYF